MIERKYTFHQMQHSDALEKHASERVDKIEKLLVHVDKPKSIEVFFNTNAHGSQFSVEIHLVSKEIRAEAHATDFDAYKALDDAMEKITHSIKKAREIIVDEHHKVDTPKKDFYKD